MPCWASRWRIIEGRGSPRSDPDGSARWKRKASTWEALSINPRWYRTERDVVTQVIKIQNERLAEFWATYPDRFVAFASVALQFPDLATATDQRHRLGRGLLIRHPTYLFLHS